MKRKWLFYLFAVALMAVVVTFVQDFFPEEQKELRSELRNSMEKAFPEQAAEVASSYGLSTQNQFNNTAASAVLIHGLDDPGKVWTSLAPELSATGMNVWTLRYPNDQPIVDSALFLHDELLRLKKSGVNEIAIVAHSMGGLVSRDMLTNPQIAYPEKSALGALPRVSTLIMVGTPNHGSELARFRLFGEFREQWVNLLESRGHILGGWFDGAGEARFDLLPESQFLTTLNERHHPANVRMLIIAGVINPWNEQDLNQLLNSSLEEQAAVEMKSFLLSMSDGLGDGLVTIESTRLDGVEHRTVPGTHLSMIRNISDGSDRIPPAVPLIVEYLGSEENF